MCVSMSVLLSVCLCALGRQMSEVQGAVQITGQVLFELHVGRPAPALHQDKTLRGHRGGGSGDEDRSGSGGGRNRTPPPACPYSYPEAAQADALLSNMLKMLTKMYIKVQQSMNKRDRHRASEEVRSSVRQAGSRVFDEIYANVTNEYRRVFEQQVALVGRRGSDDPCRHQDRLRAAWRALVDSSQTLLVRAAERCLSEYASRARGRLRARLAAGGVRAQLGAARRRQLHMLCDRFQLCYEGLL